ncbi:MAG TPA: diadenylate cyclase CdaA [Bryobacterales bacterium]|nr:diadenylate cyclase CdaA [Bryobacterales bacterium]
MPFGIPQSLLNNLPRLTLTAALDIGLVAYLIYQLLLVVRGTRAAHILLGLSLLGALYYVSRLAGLQTIHSIMANLIPYSMLAVIVLFQSEIRRTLGRLGRRPFFRGPRLGRRESYDDVLLAIAHLSQARIGALIVIERDIGLRTFVESGVALDARLSYDLLLSVFYPGGPLHDGAVIIQQDKIAAAACFLPVTTNPALAGQLGTRHRAAIGVTEESDCIALVVSEQDGRISIASAGAIELGIGPDVVRQRLVSAFGRAAARGGGALATGLGAGDAAEAPASPLLPSPSGEAERG